MRPCVHVSSNVLFGAAGEEKRLVCELGDDVAFWLEFEKTRKVTSFEILIPGSFGAIWEEHILGK